MDRVEEIAKGLTEVQRDRLVAVDPHNVSRFHYHPFKGCSRGLFQVAPGWQRMEVSPLGLAVKAHLRARSAQTEGEGE